MIRKSYINFLLLFLFILAIGQNGVAVDGSELQNATSCSIESMFDCNDEKEDEKGCCNDDMTCNSIQNCCFQVVLPGEEPSQFFASETFHLFPIKRITYPNGFKNDNFHPPEFS